MQKTILIIWLFLFVGLCIGQSGRDASHKKTKPDLGGTWILDKSKSHKVDYDLTLIIVHREPEIRITEKTNSGGREVMRESVHYTDGRSDSDTSKGRQYAKINIKWRGEKLVVENIHTTFGTRFEIVTTEEWKLSKDGRFLTRTVVNRERISTNEIIIPRMETKYVFARSS